MATPISTSASMNLYISLTDHVVRTGILKYYDPLMFSNLSLKTLSELSVVDHTLPSGSPSSGILPEGINFVTFDLTIESGV